MHGHGVGVAIWICRWRGAGRFRVSFCGLEDVLEDVRSEFGGVEKRNAIEPYTASREISITKNVNLLK